MQKQHLPMFIDALKRLTKDVSVKWDRYTEFEIPTQNVDVLSVYGWIKRTRKKSDFVIVTFQDFKDKKVLETFFTTSSVKYSPILSKNWNCSGHNKCRKWNDLLKEWGVNNDTKKK